MANCPNCGLSTTRTKDWACQWCGYPLVSGMYSKTSKTFAELKQEREGEAISTALLVETEQTTESEPVTTEQTEPTVIAEPEPVTAEQTEPIVIAEPEPVTAEQTEPTVIAEPEPVTAEQTEPTVIAEPEPVTAEQTEPIVIAEPEPVTAEKPGPTVIAEPEPVTAEQTESIVIAEPEPVTAEQTEPAVIAEPEPVTAEKEAQPVPEVTVAELCSTYQGYGMAGHEEFKNSVFRVSGIVDNIVAKDVVAQYRVALTDEEPHPLGDIYCKFEKKDAPELSKLSVGQHLTVQGKYDGFVTNIVLTDCVMVN